MRNGEWQQFKRGKYEAGTAWRARRFYRWNATAPLAMLFAPRGFLWFAAALRIFISRGERCLRGHALDFIFG